MRINGILCIYDDNNECTWASQTGRRTRNEVDPHEGERSTLSLPDSLQPIGLVKTSNLKLIRVQEKNTLLKELMLKDQAELEQPEKCIIPRLISNAILMVLNEADVVYTTLITSTADWLRAYKKMASMIIVDEADAVTLA
ncbi:hypothetical protein IFR04_004952 [Cadophora malorum]|uniref:Uncharacterized protein n=1 Tax=Cadophora malorum TaxID=108018 RepID=A0A8H7WBM7_9HELO|nr:hypothetical protein IFR04_004952 [Cadophora malorum]